MQNKQNNWPKEKCCKMNEKPQFPRVFCIILSVVFPHQGTQNSFKCVCTLHTSGVLCCNTCMERLIEQIMQNDC